MRIGTWSFRQRELVFNRKNRGPGSLYFRNHPNFRQSRIVPHALNSTSYTSFLLFRAGTSYVTGQTVVIAGITISAAAIIAYVASTADNNDDGGESDGNDTDGSEGDSGSTAQTDDDQANEGRLTEEQLEAAEAEYGAKAKPSTKAALLRAQHKLVELQVKSQHAQDHGTPSEFIKAAQAELKAWRAYVSAMAQFAKEVPNPTARVTLHDYRRQIERDEKALKKYRAVEKEKEKNKKKNQPKK